MKVSSGCSKLLLLWAVVIPLCHSQELLLPYITLNSTSGVELQQVGHFDDGVSQVIQTDHFPFGNRLLDQVYVGTNGYFSFGEPFYSPFPESFPGINTDVSSAYLVAPFWDDVDIRRRGNVFFEIHTPDTSPDLLSQVSSFVNDSFTGTWMLVAQWDEVHSWPDGESQDLRDFYESFFGLTTEANNTFQGILITNGSDSYAVFTYRCGDMTWTFNGATIGFNAAGDLFENHPNTGSFTAHEIACLSNSPDSEWNNVVYKISLDTTGTLAPPPTVEPAQASYLQYLSLDAGSNTLVGCRNCSSEPISLGDPGIAFGGYYHTSVYVGTNGIFSFGEPFIENSPAFFPTEQASTYYTYVAAPFWSDIDTRLDGSVQYKTYSSENSSEAQTINMVADFINVESGSITNANWMLAATWSGVHPFPHGNSAEQDRQDPFLQRTNTFQGIIISNGTKTYSVFTYNCDDMEWSDGAAIGFNAGGELFQNHPLSGELEAKLIGCVHQTVGSDWNNVVYDLSPGEVSEGPTPPPRSTIGSCTAANYTECCDFNVDSCLGAPSDCFCDSLCVNFGDCCYDQADICQQDTLSDNGTYLLYADNFYIGRLSLDGEVFETLPLDLLAGVAFLDFDYVRGYLYWYDYIEDGIFRSYLNGSNPIQLVNTTEFGAVEDIALDWVNNKLYWTETFYRRIEVLDLDTLTIVPLLSADLHSGVRGIAVDPINRYMYWTDWGDPAKIERASLDGTGRQTLHDTGIGAPNGIAIDYEMQTIYWTDSDLDVIEYSNVDGTNRQQLQTGLPFPYGITIEGSLIFFTDWIDNGIHTTHKLNQGNVTKFVNAFTLRPVGIIAVAANRQPEGTNYCEGNTCAHICLLSTNTQGYSCACRIGYTLDANGEDCTFTGTEAPPPTNGSCQAVGYTECCSGGFCAGTPTTCFCDSFCRGRGDCCSDIDTTCPPVPSSCIAANHTTCCTTFGTTGCTGVSTSGVCYCDEGCRGFGDCCDDIDMTCPLPTNPPTPTPAYNITGDLPYIALNSTPGVELQAVGHFDDGVSQVIQTDHFPFGNRLLDQVYVGTNGYFSFGEPFYSNFPESFPGINTDVSSAYLVAPFWDDVDIRRRGNVFFEIHTPDTSPDLLSQVSMYLSGGSFNGTWMLVAQWDQVHSWPDGESQDLRDFYESFFGLTTEANNTFQGILITDGSVSYAIYTYRCGDMTWTFNGATIGFNAAGDLFENHDNTGSFTAHEIACLNSPDSEWYNVVYKISLDTTGTLAPPPTVEPAQASYLQYLSLDTGSNTLVGCRNCSSEPISLGNPGIAFGGYYHTSVYVGTNGIFSFGEPFIENSPAFFPTEQASTYYTYVAAPFWSDIDTRLDGSVQYKTYSSATPSEAQTINMVADFINVESGSITNANWMLASTWSGVHPFPHGNSAEQDRQDPYLQRTNTFQGIIISNGTKTYSVFTYNCNDMEWSDGAAIGFNAGGELFQNHPLSGELEAKLIGCVHQTVGSDWNNVVYDLSPGEVSEGPTPPPRSTLGSCAAAGYTECCDFNVDSCLGTPSDCFCDSLCVNFGDCCYDQADICQQDTLSDNNSTYLLFADHFYIGRLSLDGEVFETLPLDLLAGVAFLDFDYVRGYLYWYDYIRDGIFRSYLNGSNLIQLVNTTEFGAVEDIALDWVNNKLYWTETFYRRIEVLDLDTLTIVPLLSVDLHSGVRGIAVDPINRYMYWTDWGDPAKIERASLDGTGRQTLHDTGIGAPNGIAIDYETQTIYWTDSDLDVIEYSNVDGTNRQQLQTGLPFPYGITIEGSLIFFTDWIDNGIHTTHKLNQDNVTKFVNAFTLQPVGIIAVAANRQPEGTNYCEGNTCAHICLLSTNAQGYSCACRIGYTLDANGEDCTFTGTEPPPPTDGSCQEVGYTECCSGGFCAGTPTTCFCDAFCRNRGDCCSDIDTTCPSPPSSCSAAGYDTCCTTFATTGCVGVSSSGTCYCDDGCRAFGDCCDDIDTTCPLPTQPPTPTPFPGSNDTSVMTYIVLNTTAGVLAESIGHFDDGVSHAIHVAEGFPFGNLQHTFIFISTNGIISFGEPFYTLPPALFPSAVSTVAGSYLVAPFWSDVDITAAGAIQYEVHTGTTGLVGTVSDFVSRKTGLNFTGDWMLVVSWEDVHPWPNGIADTSPIWPIFFPDYADSNSYQAILITDGTDSFSVFTYRCGDMEWARGGVIGYNAAGDFFTNHPLSGETGTPSIACSNNDNSPWNNVIYRLSVNDPTGTVAPPTVEPPQATYLPMLDYTSAGATGALSPCRNCTSGEISIPQFPFGLYYHSSVYVGTNGIISFGQEFLNNLPEAFPSETDISVYTAFLVAPYWSNVDTRLDGTVDYQVLNAGVGGTETTGRFTQVTSFINSETDPDFAGGSWMLVATWRGVHPFPHGASAEQDRQDPYLQSTNTFQSILISNGTKAYAVFTYVCDNVEWSGEPTIGINAGGSYYRLHPLSGRVHSSAIDCVHLLQGQTINNVVYDLAPTVPQGTQPPPTDRVEIPFVVGTTQGVETQVLPPLDDGASEAINISIPFPFANSYQTQAFVITNGLITFGEPLLLHIPYSFPTAFPGVYNSYILAPFWSDVDASAIGEIKYEVHDINMDISGSNFLIGQVNDFITNKTGEQFAGTWMLAVLWDEVHPYAGFFPGAESNKYQAIAITDGTTSYALYTYQCGQMEWSGGAVIGYNGGSQTDYFFVHPLSGSDDAQTVACLEFPDSQWTNLLYKISIESVVTPPPPVTVEPGQSEYLEFIEKTGTNQEVLESCDDCHSNNIDVPDIAFGSYRHSTAYVSTNGIISFGREFTQTTSVLFPSAIASVHYAYAIAPYWADIDTRSQGEVWREVHIRGSNRESDDLLDRVSGFVNTQTAVVGFSGTWMLVATWDSVPPYSGAVVGSVNDTNTFQGIVISNGDKTFAVFTYKCDLLTWSNEGTIGYNAASDNYFNHQLSGTTASDAIDCVHSLTDGSVWNNVVYDLVPGTVNDGPTPLPPASFGSCVEAGFTSCCTDVDCLGSAPSDCFCDSGCHQFDDCCYDILETCDTTPTSLDTTLLVAAQYTIIRLSESNVENLLVTDLAATIIAIDYDYRQGYIYYSDVAKQQIVRVDFDGSNKQILVDSGIASVDGLAVDWVNNKLYWTDAIYTRIEVMDLETMNRKTLFDIGLGSAPRAIVIDPTARYMYWTDWGNPAMIERASLDGTGREVLHNTGLVWPNGLTLDFAEQRIYWADASLDRIEYSNMNGSGRVLLETEDDGLVHPFGITLDKNTLYWTDWSEDTVYSTHKLLGATIVPVYEDLAFNPSGIESVSLERQMMANNPCEGLTCSYLCLQSNTAASGYTCACPDGQDLLEDGRSCTNDSTVTTQPPPEVGSCKAAGYTGCCTGGVCAGLPPTCFCEVTCVFYGDCCPDFFELHQPVPISNLNVDILSSTSMNISWTLPAELEVCQDSKTEVEIVTYTGTLVLTDTLNSEVNFLLVDEGIAKWIPYNITVQAVTSLQDGTSLTDLVFTEEGVPQLSPSNVTTSRISATEMIVSWKPLTPVEAQGFISVYTVFYTPTLNVNGRRRQASGGSKSVSGDKSQVFIDNLQSGISYSVSVAANTKAGAGPTSEQIDSGVGATPGANTGTPGGTVAAVVIVILILAVVATAVVVVLVFIFRRRRKVELNGDFARFSNDDDDTVTLTRSSTNKSEQTPTLTFKQLSEAESGFDNPVYLTSQAPKSEGESQYTSVKAAPPTYADITNPDQQPILADSEYQTVDELKAEETKEDLGAQEKEDLGKKSGSADDEEPARATLNTYQRMDEI